MLQCGDLHETVLETVATWFPIRLKPKPTNIPHLHVSPCTVSRGFRSKNHSTSIMNDASRRHDIRRSQFCPSRNYHDVGRMLSALSNRSDVNLSRFRLIPACDLDRDRRKPTFWSVQVAIKQCGSVFIDAGALGKLLTSAFYLFVCKQSCLPLTRLSMTSPVSVILHSSWLQKE